MTKRRKIIVFIATSADGFIARCDGSVEWLNRPRTAGDYGMGAFFKTIDTILWGRKTYDVALAFNEEGGGIPLIAPKHRGVELRLLSVRDYPTALCDFTMLWHGRLNVRASPRKEEEVGPIHKHPALLLRGFARPPCGAALGFGVRGRNKSRLRLRNRRRSLRSL